MLMPNTSLLIAGHDLHMLDEVEGGPQVKRAATARRSHRNLTSLARLANRVMSLFL